MKREPTIVAGAEAPQVGIYQPPQRTLLERLLPIEVSPVERGHFAWRGDDGREVMFHVSGWLARLIWFFALKNEQRRILHGKQSFRYWTAVNNAVPLAAFESKVDTLEPGWAVPGERETLRVFHECE